MKHKSDLLDKKLVHKKKTENVLIYGLRRTLPRKISADIMENKLLKKLDEVDVDFLLQYYSKEKYIFLKSDKKQKNDYFLRIIPHEVDNEVLNNIINPDELLYKDLKYLLKYYYRDKKKNKFYLIDDEIEEDDEIKILQLFDLQDWYIKNNDKIKISDILEKIDDIKKENIFFCNMYVKIDHQFFFEHSTEHVPALMIIEAARQFLIALCHKYFNVPFTGINFILEGMEINFLSYLELNYPIKMVGQVNEVKMKRGILSFLDLNITIWQRNKEIAEINFLGKVIKSIVFKELRKEKNKLKVIPRFHPRPLFYHNIFIRKNSKTKYLCDLIDLSRYGFQVKFHNKFPSENKKLSYEFFIFFQELGVIHGVCSVKWSKKEDDSIVSGFEIKEIQDDDYDNLQEALKRFCYVREDREII